MKTWDASPNIVEPRNGGTMKLKGFVVIVTLFALHTTAFSEDVFSGTWKTIIEKSQFSPGPILKPRGPNFTRMKVFRMD